MASNPLQTPTDRSNPNPNPSLASWFHSPSNGYVPLSQVAFGATFSAPTPVPQYPDPTGVRGNTVATFNKLAASAPMQRIFNGARNLSRF